MKLLELKSTAEIKTYGLDGYSSSQVKALVFDQIWKGKFAFPTLASITIDPFYQGLGLSYPLLKKITHENPYLLFHNYNFSFWLKLSKKNRLPYQIILHGYAWGEIIRKCC